MRLLQRVAFLFDHIVPSFSSRVLQKCVINVGLPDNQLFCARKIPRIKTVGVNM